MLSKLSSPNGGFLDTCINRPYLVILLTIFLAYFGVRHWQKSVEQQAEDRFGEEHGCQPVLAKVPFKWPLSLDLVRASLRANSQQHLLALYTQFFDSLGPNLEMTLLGGVSYVTIDPENVEYILSNSRDFCFGSRRGAFLHFLGEGLFTQDGKEWKHSRDVLRQQFMRMEYKNLDGFNQHVDNLISRISTVGNVVDLQPLFYQFTLDVTTDLVFGQSVGSLEDKESIPFANSFDRACYMTAIRTRLCDAYWAYTTPEFVRVCADVKRYCESYVAQSLKEDSANGDSMKGDFVRILYDEYKDIALVRDQLINLLLAGRDTTACLLSWTFFLLVRNPMVLRCLKDEIAAMGKSGESITRADIQKMSYLDSVLRETLRLYPPVAINVRSSTKATILPRGGGADGRSPVLMRAGMGIGWSSYHMHRRKDLYGEDADVFRPERWQGPSLNNIGWAYVPFNGGPRLCLGKDFALMEVSVAVIRIIQTFPEMRIAPGAVVEPTGSERQVLTLTLSSATGCAVQLKQ